MNNWKLGDRVQITHRLTKQTWDPETYKPFFVDAGKFGNPTEKRWVPIAERHEGVIVGHRTVQNNWVHYDYEYGGSAVPTKYINAYLVAYDMRKTPVYVLPEHMVRIP